MGLFPGPGDLLLEPSTSVGGLRRVFAFAYLQYLVSSGALPVVGQSQVSKEIEGSLRILPLPWTLRDRPPPSITHDAFWRLSAQEREAREQHLRSMPSEWARQPSGDRGLFWEALQPPLYYWLLSAPFRVFQDTSLPARVIMLRWLSVAIASLVVPLGFLSACAVFHDDGTALGVVALIAAMPELMVDISRVGNESLGIVLYTLLIYSTLRLLDDPTNGRHALILGWALGLGLLTKAYFLTTGPALALIFAWAAWRQRRFRAKTVLSGILAASTALVLSGWWYLRNYTLTGFWFWQSGAQAIQGKSLATLLRRIPEVDWQNVQRSVLISHIWFGGWSFLQVRGWMYKFFGDIVILAVAGLVVHAWRELARTQAQTTLEARPAHFLALTSFYCFFCLGLAYHALLMFVLQHVSATDGWYLYCPVVAEVALVTSGVFALSPRRVRQWILPFTATFFALLDLYGMHFIMVPYYSGFISHDSKGILTAFHVGILRDYRLTAVVARLLVNKPEWLTTPGFIACWLLFLASTIGLPVLSFQAGGPLHTPPQSGQQAGLS